MDLPQQTISVTYRPELKKWVVDVKVMKENTLRGDRYYVSKAFRLYNKEKDARMFASRF